MGGRPVDSAYYDENYYLSDNDGYKEFAAGLDQNVHKKFFRALKIMDPQKGKSVLDIGCGRGEIAYYCAQKGCKVKAVDYSQEAIKIAYKTVQKLPSEQRKLVSIEHIDITKYESDEKYDLIFLVDVVEHLTQKQVLNLFKTLKRVLAENGKIFMSTPNGSYERYFYVFKHIMQWPLKPLKNILRLLKGKMQAKNLREFLVKSFCILPKKSKSLEIMHVNVMSPAQLRKILLQYDLVGDFFEGLKITDREIVAIIEKRKEADENFSNRGCGISRFALC